MKRFSIALMSTAAALASPAQSATLFQSVVSFDEAGLGEWHYNRGSDEDSEANHRLYSLISIAQDSTLESFKLAITYNYNPMDIRVKIFALDLNGLPTGVPLVSKLSTLSGSTLIPRAGFGGNGYLFDIDTEDFALTAGSYALSFVGVADGQLFGAAMWTGADQSIQISTNGWGQEIIEYLDAPVRGVAFSIEGSTIAAPAVPEPATWAMMIAGFAAIGTAMRQRKLVNAVRFA